MKYNSSNSSNHSGIKISIIPPRMWQHPPAYIFLYFERSFPPRNVHSIPNMASTKPSMPTDRADMRRPLTTWMLPGGETQCRCKESIAQVMQVFQDLRLVTDPPQTRAQGSRSSYWQQWSLWNKISTGWTSTRPPWWWRSPPFHRWRWSSSPPWPWCRRWRSSPEPSAGRPKSGPPESSSQRLNLGQLSVESNTGPGKR